MRDFLWTYCYADGRTYEARFQAASWEAANVNAETALLACDDVVSITVEQLS